jgi:hypothetical protein
MLTIFLLESLKKKDNSVDQDVDERIILKCILGKLGKSVWTGYIWSRKGTVGGVLSTW